MAAPQGIPLTTPAVPTRGGGSLGDHGVGVAVTAPFPSVPMVTEETPPQLGLRLLSPQHPDSHGNPPPHLPAHQ